MGIILRGENALLDYKSMNTKYYFWDDGNGLVGHKNVTMTLSWNIIPNAGNLPRYRVFIKYCGFFSRILESLPPLPRQHSTSIGCKKNYQPIGLTVHSHCVESFEGLLQRCRRGRGCGEL